MNIISSVVGTALLIAAFTLSYLASNNGEALLEKQNTIVMKYVSESNEALEAEEIKEAIKYAKLAIKTDPKNKIGYKAYENAMELKYKPADSDEESYEETPNSKEDEDDDGDMGC